MQYQRNQSRSERLSDRFASISIIVFLVKETTAVVTRLLGLNRSAVNANVSGTVNRAWGAQYGRRICTQERRKTGVSDRRRIVSKTSRGSARDGRVERRTQPDRRSAPWDFTTA
ncbi:MAG: hypothetical protein AAGI44_04795 [Pseudomonadota bacterium]